MAGKNFLGVLHFLSQAVPKIVTAPVVVTAKAVKKVVKK